jgi:hypothetical protein
MKTATLARPRHGRMVEMPIPLEIGGAPSISFAAPRPLRLRDPVISAPEKRGAVRRAADFRLSLAWQLHRQFLQWKKMWLVVARS